MSIESRGAVLFFLIIIRMHLVLMPPNHHETYTVMDFVSSCLMRRWRMNRIEKGDPMNHRKPLLTTHLFI